MACLVLQGAATPIFSGMTVSPPSDDGKGMVKHADHETSPSIACETSMPGLSCPRDVFVRRMRRQSSQPRYHFTDEIIKRIEKNLLKARNIIARLRMNVVSQVSTV